MTENRGTGPAPAAQAQSASEARIEVRIRKLHLARPDLLPYPLNFEVIC